MSSLVSVLIPTYNRADMISETLNSALSQTYSNLEVIVCDNASTDATIAIVEEFARRDSRVKLFKNETNLGPVLNWKACLDRASGQYVKVLWSDDLMLPDFLERTLELFREDNNLAFVFTKVSVSREISDPLRYRYDCFDETGIYPVAEFVKGVIQHYHFPYSPGCAIFKIEVLKQSFVMRNDLFKNRYLQNGAGPDLLMFLMSTRRAPRFGYVDEPLSFFRQHDDSITISSDSRQLGLDYAKAIIWYIYRFSGLDMAMRYWIYVFKKRKLYQKKNRAYLSGFLFQGIDVHYLCPVNAVHFLQCWVMKSKHYLKSIQLDFTSE